MKFFKKIFSPAILSFSLLLLTYTLYKSEIYWDGNKRSYYLTYYFISSLFVFFSVTTFFFSQKTKEYLVISIISVLISLYLFEGYIIYKESIKKKVYQNQTGNKWDDRSLIQVFEDLKKKNKKAVVTIGSKKYNINSLPIFSLSGISNSETLHCNENGYYSIFDSDRYGFNNPNNEWDQKEVEYLLVGDSFVQGECVNRPNDITSVLRSLSGKSALNLGQGGAGPMSLYAILREYLNTNVKKVLWIYYEGNDLEDLEREKRNNILNNYLNDPNFTQNLKFRQSEIDVLATNYILKSKKNKKLENHVNSFTLKIVNFFKLNNLRSKYQLLLNPKFIYKLLIKKTSPQSLSEFKKILLLSKELVNKNNSKLYFVYLPEYDRFKLNYDNKSYNSVKNIISELDIPFIDLNKEVFEKEENPLKLFPFELFGHYNVEGYKKVAENIYKLTNE